MRTIIVTSANRIATVTLNRPEARNAINTAMHEELTSFWLSFDRDPNLDVAILTGAGEAFCAGADLKEYIPKWLSRTFQDVRDNVMHGLGGITRGIRVKKPVIAAVNGWALAGGFELALACDVRIASDQARFGSYEIHRGFHHGDGGIVRLVNSIGVSRTMDILFTGREISAEEALSIGLVTRVVPAEALLGATQEYADNLVSKSQGALQSAKETVLEVVGKSMDQALKIEAIFGYSSGDTKYIEEQLNRFASKNANRGEA
ncbi:MULTISPECIES: enoyl-CoA hydratase/isomerase family protein [Bradyrhizobium]|uniref:enoyl-CoA hydratase/isomerase family protein n=1 Tax=Bradyrhizobium TaxID=374 RepID=UPI000577FFC0|nr:MULTISPECIES: enoyl-CoA hydratase/isomerase family protein [Bradyrhizobium]MDI2077390.1 enoyl-CoA hydratase/isomerase family protein [Bradyrhizobium sp. Mp27]